MESIPFNKSHISGRELFYLADAVRNGDLRGDGPFTKKSSLWLEENLKLKKVLLTNSGTAALELAALLTNISPGDEVIIPSYTFPSTANAFLLRGAKIILADIREDTLNIDERKIETLITKNTKSICPVHYAGVSANMDKILEIADSHNLTIIEDAAQGIFSKYKSQFLGGIGDIGAFSFHETKNISTGEGGALIINQEKFIERAEILREKGTNRNKYFRGEIDKYSWVDIGSSFLPSEITAAYLYAQLEMSARIQERRKLIWNQYFEALKDLEFSEHFKLQHIPEHCEQNFHMFYLILNSEVDRDNLLCYLKERQIGAVFHYLPLHLSPMGKALGYKKGDLPVAEEYADRILRLPFYYDLGESNQYKVISTIHNFFKLR